MNQEEMLTVFSGAVMVAIRLAGPLLLTSIVVGLVISIIQAATQIHEQTLTFVPKLLAIALCLLMLGGWMMTTLTDFTIDLFDMMANMRI